MTVVQSRQQQVLKPDDSGDADRADPLTPRPPSTGGKRAGSQGWDTSASLVRHSWPARVVS
jgi:hypothetical protein